MDLLPRGVYRAPHLDPLGQTILYAVRANHCLLETVYLLPGDNPFEATDQLWDLLDQVDPSVTSSGEAVA